MKKIIVMCAALVLSVSAAIAGNNLTLKDITSGKFAPKGIGSITALTDGESYAQEKGSEVFFPHGQTS